VAIGVLIGTVTSAGALYFGLQAGGDWIASRHIHRHLAAMDPQRCRAHPRIGPCPRDRARPGHRAARFSAFKIIWIHESASYLIASLDLVLLACLTAASTRRFITR
jgi:hypothetical protein